MTEYAGYACNDPNQPSLLSRLSCKLFKMKVELCISIYNLLMFKESAQCKQCLSRAPLSACTE